MRAGWHYTNCFLCGKKRAPPHNIHAKKLTYGKYAVCKACTELDDYNERLEKKKRELEKK